MSYSNADVREHLRQKFLRDQYHALLWAMRRDDGDWAEVVTQQLGNDIVGFIEYLIDDMEERRASRTSRATIDGAPVLNKLYDIGFIPRSRRAYFLALCRSLCGASQSTRNYARHIERLVGILARPLDSSEPRQQPLLFSRQPLREARGRGRLTRVEAFHYLFVWSILMSLPSMMMVFWNRGGYSLPNALLGCQMLKRMAGLAALRHYLKFQPHVNRFTSMAIQLEEAALGVLTQVRGLESCLHRWKRHRCPRPLSASTLVSSRHLLVVSHATLQCHAADEKKTLALLSCPYSLFRLMPPVLLGERIGIGALTCVDQAMGARAMQFISHAAVDNEVSCAGDGYPLLFVSCCPPHAEIFPLVLILALGAVHVELSRSS
jgi:hypothetical protein